MPDDVDFVEVINEFVESQFDEVHTMMPGELVNFSTSDELATIRPQVTEVGGRTLPDLVGVHLLFPGPYWKPSVGTTGIIWFSESDFSSWWRTGEVSEPSLVLRHDLHGSVFVPGIRKKGDQRSYNGYDEMIVPGPKVRLGSSSAVQALIKGNDYTGHENTFLTALTAWANAVATAVGDPTLTAATTTFTTAISTFQGQLSGDLSTVSKTD